MPILPRVASNLIEAVRVLGAALVMQAALYRLQKAYHVARFDETGRTLPIRDTLRRLRPALAQPTRRPEPPAPERFTFVGTLQRHRLAGQTVEIICDGGALWLAILAPDLIRVRFSPAGRFAPLFSYAVEKTDEQWPACAFDIAEEEADLVIRTTRLTIRVSRTPCRLRFYDAAGVLITEDAAGVGTADPWVGCWRQLAADEHIYGLGEKAFGLDHRGRRYEMWNTDPGGYGPGCDPLYKSFPCYVGLRAGRAYGLFFDNTYRSIFDIGQTQAETLSFLAEAGELRYYFSAGPTPAAVLERYTELTGRMSLPPLWALGYHQSRWSYYPEARVREIAGEFRRRDIPCDALYFDIHYMDGYRDFTWDAQRFPDPAGLIADLADAGFKSVALIDAGVKADPAYPACASGLQRDVFLKRPDGSLFTGPVWPGACYFPDFTLPAARAWWAEQCAGFLQAGLAGVWNDMNEPIIMGHTGDCPPDHVRHDYEGYRSDHRAAHNVYGMQMARATREGVRQALPERRPFVITRAAFCGVQRYSLGWTGDNESTWGSLAVSIPMLLNLGLSGLAFSGPDSGGFMGSADGELLTRWIQLGAFTPFFRNHSTLISHDQEPWAFGEPYTSICRQYIQLRYRFLPLLYTAFWQAAQTGAPIARPLLWDWPADPRAAVIEDQFLVGDHLLVAPVLQPFGMQRSVYLPAGDWFDWWSQQRIAGPTEIVANAPLDILPLYVRAGAVVPLAELDAVINTTDITRRLTALSLGIYAGNAISHLYEDAGEGWGYLDKECRRTVFETRWDGHTLVLRRQTTGSFTPAYAGFRLNVYGLPAAPASISLDGAPVSADYIGSPATLSLVTADFHELKIELPLQEPLSASGIFGKEETTDG